MPSRGRHQSSCKHGRRSIARVEALDGVVAVIIGMSVGGKSLGSDGFAGLIRVQREDSGGLKAAMQSSKGVQELFVRLEEGADAQRVRERIEGLF